MATPVTIFGSMIEVTVNQTFLGQKCENVLHFSTLDQFISAPSATTDFTFVFDGIGAAVEAVFTDLLTPYVQLDSLDIRWLYAPLGALPKPSLFWSSFLGGKMIIDVPGERVVTDPEGAVPSFVAAGVNTTPKFTNKYTRGKMRVCGLDEVEIADNEVSETTRTSIQTILSDLLGGILVTDAASVETDWKWCVSSQSLGWANGVLIPNYGNTNCFEITEVNPRIQVSSQLSRKAGKGQ